MPARDQWSSRYQFWASMSTRSNALFLAGVFFMFIPAGLLSDIPRLGVNGPLRLLANAIFSGGVAVLYVAVLSRRPQWFAIPIAVQLLITVEFDRLFGAPGPPLTGSALQARLAADVNVSTVAIIISFVLLSNLIRSEGTRYGRVRAEMALARDIHRLLVPAIARQVEGFELRGVSLPSGDVGGDLIDFVETPQGWTSFVADVSGHGVAAGLLMGMVKSTARTLLRAGANLDRLQDSLNSVLFDLKSPAMFVTLCRGPGGSRRRPAVYRRRSPADSPRPRGCCRGADGAADSAGDVRGEDLHVSDADVRARRSARHPH